MDSFDLIDPGHDAAYHFGYDLGLNRCNSDASNLSNADHLSEAIAAAHLANGMDPAAAALQARIDAPLIRPLLF